MLVNRLQRDLASVARTPEGAVPSARLVFCISLSRGRADSIIVDLLDDGIAGADIAVLFLDPDRSVETPAAGVVVPASSGAIRGVIARLAGVRRVVARGVGPVVVSGGLATSVRAGGIGSLPLAFERFGVPSAEAARFAGRVAQGHFFIAVRTSSSNAADRARDIFLANKAEEVCTKLDVVRPETGGAHGGISARKDSS